MDLSKFLDALQGALWRKDRPVVLIVSRRSFCPETVAHPRIFISRKTPSPGSIPNSVGVVLFVRPFDTEQAARLCDHLPKQPRTILWEHPFELIEHSLFVVLERNKPRSEKPVKFPKPIKLPALPVIGKGNQYGAFGRDFILSNADPMAKDIEADIRRIHALIPDGPFKPGIPTLRDSYHRLAAQGKLGLYRLSGIKY